PSPCVACPALLTLDRSTTTRGRRYYLVRSLHAELYTAHRFAASGIFHRDFRPIASGRYRCHRQFEPDWNRPATRYGQRAQIDVARIVHLLVAWHIEQS